MTFPTSQVQSLAFLHKILRSAPRPFYQILFFHSFGNSGASDYISYYHILYFVEMTKYRLCAASSASPVLFSEDCTQHASAQAGTDHPCAPLPCQRLFIQQGRQENQAHDHDPRYTQPRQQRSNSHSALCNNSSDHTPEHT